MPDGFSHSRWAADPQSRITAVDPVAGLTASCEPECRTLPAVPGVFSGAEMTETAPLTSGGNRRNPRPKGLTNEYTLGKREK